MRFLRPLGVLVAVLAVAVASASSAATAREPGLSHVALGDSYTAGSGGGAYLEQECRLSENSYPQQLSDRNEWELESNACAGARIQDVLDGQLSALTADTDLVTISVGGNDAGWVDVIATCMMVEDDECEDHISQARQNIRDDLYQRLRDLYQTIENRAPNAVTVVVGYPRLFAEIECGDAPGLTVPEQQGINRAADMLNRTIMSAAFAENLWFIDVRGQFLGHGICDPDPWINGPSTVAGDSYHPNATGYRAYTDAVDWLWD